MFTLSRERRPSEISPGHPINRGVVEKASKSSVNESLIPEGAVPIVEPAAGEGALSARWACSAAGDTRQIKATSGEIHRARTSGTFLNSNPVQLAAVFWSKLPIVHRRS